MGYYIDFIFDQSEQLDWGQVVERFRKSGARRLPDEYIGLAAEDVVRLLCPDYGYTITVFREESKQIKGKWANIRMSCNENSENVMQRLHYISRLADKLGCRAYDGQIKRYVTKNDFDTIVSSFTHRHHDISDKDGCCVKAKDIQLRLFDAEKQRFLSLIRHWHAGHHRADQVEHCINVMQWLEQALDQEPGPIRGRRAMILAALGHDLYEDSRIDPVQVVTEYGVEVDQLIEGMTERSGVSEYVERVASGSEEARLIKLCDGIDNYGGLVKIGLVRADPVRWVDVVRKQMEPMFSRIASVPFRQYTVAGGWLSQQLTMERERFWAEVSAILCGRTESGVTEQ